MITLWHATMFSHCCYKNPILFFSIKKTNVATKRPLCRPTLSHSRKKVTTDVQVKMPGDLHWPHIEHKHKKIRCDHVCFGLFFGTGEAISSLSACISFSARLFNASTVSVGDMSGDNRPIALILMLSNFAWSSCKGRINYFTSYIWVH